MGEIVKYSPEEINGNRDISIMPEFLLFHELSGQGVLSLMQLNEVETQSPFSLLAKSEMTVSNNGENANGHCVALGS